MDKQERYLKEIAKNIADIAKELKRDRQPDVKYIGNGEVMLNEFVEIPKSNDGIDISLYEIRGLIHRLDRTGAVLSPEGDGLFFKGYDVATDKNYKVWLSFPGLKLLTVQSEDGELLYQFS